MQDCQSSCARLWLETTTFWLVLYCDRLNARGQEVSLCYIDQVLALFTYACSGADIVDPANIMLQLTQCATSKQLGVLPDRPVADTDCCTVLSICHTVFVCCISLNDIRTIQQMLAVQLTEAV